MFAHTADRRKLLWMVFVAIVILVLLPMLLGAVPPTAPSTVPPVGTWVGQTHDGRAVTMILTEDGGFYLEGAMGELVTGVWTWEPLPDNAGTIRCEPGDWPAHRITFYRVTWLDGHRLEVSNLYFRAVLQRMV